MINVSTNGVILLVLGGLGTVISVLWNLWLTAERRAAKAAHDALVSRVDQLEREIAKVETTLEKRLDRIEGKLDRVLEHKGDGQ